MGITLDQIIALLFNPTVATTVFMLFAGRLSEKYRTKAERRLEGQKQAAAENIVSASSQAVDMMQGMLDIVKKEYDQRFADMQAAHDREIGNLRDDLSDITAERDDLKRKVARLTRQVVSLQNKKAV